MYIAEESAKNIQTNLQAEGAMGNPFDLTLFSRISARKENI